MTWCNLTFQDVRERYPDVPYVGYIPTSGYRQLIITSHTIIIILHVIIKVKFIFFSMLLLFILFSCSSDVTTVLVKWIITH